MTGEMRNYGSSKFSADFGTKISGGYGLFHIPGRFTGKYKVSFSVQMYSVLFGELRLFRILVILHEHAVRPTSVSFC